MVEQEQEFLDEMNDFEFPEPSFSFSNPVSFQERYPLFWSVFGQDFSSSENADIYSRQEFAQNNEDFQFDDNVVVNSDDVSETNILQLLANLQTEFGT